MLRYVYFVFTIGFSASLKTWIPNTNVDNELNWDSLKIPSECEKINLKVNNHIAVFWSLTSVSASGLSLPIEGNVIFSNDVSINIIDKSNCRSAETITFTRNNVKGWLDPDNWKSDSASSWMPHIERIPCAGETVVFPPGKMFSVELPAVSLPINRIIFDDQEYFGDDWSQYLNSPMGFENFQGSNELRELAWRHDVGCFDRKSCICSRSPYVIKDGNYRDVSPETLQEAVCFYARPRCEIPKCLHSVIPDGHCCGICGAVIRLKDDTEEGLDVDEIQAKVNKEFEDGGRKSMAVYTGRTKDGDVQIVVVATDPEETITAITFASLLEEKLTAQSGKHTIISARFSGLPASDYFFNRSVGVVFGMLLAVIISFVSIYYIYVILPKKRLSISKGNPFTFARFENTVHESSSEENLEIGTEFVESNDATKAFDNPMYSSEPSTSKSGPKADLSETPLGDELAFQKEESNDPTSGEAEKPETELVDISAEKKEESETKKDADVFDEVKF